MIEQIALSSDKPVIALASEIVYLQKPYWCDCSARSLKMSVMGPRSYFPYDPPAEPQPCIVFFCGGAFQKQDRDVWIPELSFFAHHGYTVVTVDYSTLPYTEFPEQLIEAKNAIRFLRAHAQEFHIDKERIAAMGESAGGQIASWLGVTGETTEYDKGTYLEENSAVQCCVAWYPVSNVNIMSKPQNQRIYMDNYLDTCDLISCNTPPFFLMHGLADDQVPSSQSVRIHDKLASLGKKECELLLLEGANHADLQFVQPEVQTRVLKFLDAHLKLEE